MFGNILKYLGYLTKLPGFIAAITTFWAAVKKYFNIGTSEAPAKEQAEEPKAPKTSLRDRLRQRRNRRRR